jgi:sensor c-di-GMP phosphodiesterase-like protein
MEQKKVGNGEVPGKRMRRRYFIHSSSQLKYIAMSVLPAFLISLFCTFFVVKSGEYIIEREKYKLFVELSSFHQTVSKLEQSRQYTPEVREKIQGLQAELRSIEDILRITYTDTIREWEKTKVIIFIFLPIVLLFVGFIALIYSHRVAGPLFRLKRSLEMLSEGKDVPAFRFRTYDEFKELAISFERLQKSLREKGFVK